LIPLFIELGLMVGNKVLDAIGPRDNVVAADDCGEVFNNGGVDRPSDKGVE
jgi:hypothetical protein